MLWDDVALIDSNIFAHANELFFAKIESDAADSDLGVEFVQKSWWRKKFFETLFFQGLEIDWLAGFFSFFSLLSLWLALLHPRSKFMLFLKHTKANVLLIIVMMPIDWPVIDLIVSWQSVTAVRYAIFLFRDFFFHDLLSMFTEIQETDHSSEFRLDLTLIVTAHELL